MTPADPRHPPADPAAALEQRLAREVLAHDAERQAHAATAQRLARVTGERAALEAQAAALRRELAALRLWRRSQIQALVRRQFGRAARLARRLLGRPAAGAPARPPRLRLRALARAPDPPPPAAGSRRLLCVTHLLPWPPRAGNAYRITRLLGWLRQQGWEPLLVVCPSQNAELSAEQLREAAARFGELLVCRHDGILLHHLRPDSTLLAGLEGRQVRGFAAALGEADDPAAGRLATLQRTFCPDPLVELLLHLEARWAPAVVLAEYAFMARAFPLLGRAAPEAPALKVIDTIDVFSNKHDKVEGFGIDEDFALDAAEEATLLRRADLLLAIQPEEAADLRRLAPGVPVAEVGVDFDVPVARPPLPAAPVLLFVASDNRINARGLDDFLRFAWPLVRRALPDAELRVAGALALAMPQAPAGVRLLGPVAALDAVYAAARAVINPAVAGTGLKIKTIEALCHGRPVVLWPAGAEGLAPEARAACDIAEDWLDFAERVVEQLRPGGAGESKVLSRPALERLFSPAAAYGPLAEALAGVSRP